MNYTVFGRIENGTSMTESFTSLAFFGLEVPVIGFMYQEGFDLSACGIINSEESIERSFPTKPYIDGEDLSDKPASYLDLRGIDPSALVASLRKYALQEGVKDLSETARGMGAELTLAHEKRLVEIHGFLVKTCVTLRPGFASGGIIY